MVLLLSLTFLVILTILGVAAVNLSTTNLRIIGNAQLQQQAEATAMRGIEVAISDVSHFTNKDAAIADLPSHVTIAERNCLWASSTGTNDDTESYSKQWELAPETTIWELQSTYDDNDANVTLRQGVRIKMTADSCI
jgi:Tfp pilus assembly protein PilX